MSTLNNYEDELNEILDENEESLIHYDPTWKIDSLELAVWADEKIHEKEVKIAEVEKVANSNIEALKVKIEKLEAWKTEATNKDKNEITFFKEHLHLYHRKMIEKETMENEELKAKGKKEKKISKTIKLPHRDLTCKAQQPAILINGKEPSKAKEDSELLAFVKENSPEFIKTKEEVEWGEYKKKLKTTVVDGKLTYVDETGSKLDFITLQELGDKYDWKQKKD
ncbi:host-nuclease inhibitor Gam family protein [Paenibacillus sp. FSL L8-0435]|uniref:host-nuclease inhibitor Gam family protein n=1 Tax=Paenibacillus sp. FSL L8-0435 TaxID=2954618 RepID=UPI0030DC2D2C